jgi:putative transposase
MAQRSNFSEAQMIATLQEIEGGTPQADVARKLGVTAQTLLRWRAKYGGMTVSEAQDKRRLEDENRKLRWLVAQQALDIAALRELVGRKW